MDACGVNANRNASESFNDIYEAMQDDKYWIKFFCRPCCPAPALNGAIDMLDKLEGELSSRDDFTDDQRQQMSALIEERKEWYPTSGLCRLAK